MNRKASFHGLSFGTTRADLIKAALESICFQVRAVLDAMGSGSNPGIGSVAIHGGISQNGFIRECLASLLKATIRNQGNPEISAQGAALLAGLQANIFQSQDEIKSLLKLNTLQGAARSNDLNKRYSRWLDLIRTV